MTTYRGLKEARAHALGLLDDLRRCLDRPKGARWNEAAQRVLSLRGAVDRLRTDSHEELPAPAEDVAFLEDFADAASLLLATVDDEDFVACTDLRLAVQRLRSALA